MNSEQVKQAARACGADIVGIASIGSFNYLPKSQNPLEIKPDTKSVIVLGYERLRGSLRPGGIDTPFSTMMEQTYNLCRILETEGYECVPLNRLSSDLRNQGVQIRDGRATPDVIVNMSDFAYRAGLGCIGKSGMFLSPQLGPRQELMAILTDLELEPDNVYENDLCGDCLACIDACPAQALSDGKLNSESCRVCNTGAKKRNYDTGYEPSRVAAACGRACVAALDASDNISRKYHNTFAN